MRRKTYDDDNRCEKMVMRRKTYDDDNRCEKMVMRRKTSDDDNRCEKMIMRQTIVCVLQSAATSTEKMVMR
ncbi:hypothetical protein GW17_00028466 [Ensete ventricosum]|nr:hypothetical protein GW17_00028466 [Ensete ventricosum]